MTQQEMFGKAVWLTAKDCKNTDILVLEGRFTLRTPKQATLRVLGLGFFHCYINGKRVGDDLFLPLNSEYEPRENFPTQEQLSAFRTYVPEYDVTPLLCEGENRIVIHFGGGWYTFEQHIAQGLKKYGDPKAIWRLFGEDADGAFDLTSAKEDRIAKSFVCGYRFDRFEVHDYTLPDPLKECAETVWENAVLATAPDTSYDFSDCPADAVMETLPTLLVGQTGNVHTYDCQKNTSGWPVLRLFGKRGETVRVLMGEELTAAGELDPKFTHKQEFICTCDGTEREAHALFDWFGFRYFSVEGPAEPLCVQAAYTRAARTSDFHCDNDVLNWLHDAYLNTQYANMHAGIPSDCPHIERRGYTGDGQLACRPAMKMLDTEAFYRKWMQDIADCQDLHTGHVQNTAPYTHSGGGPGGFGCAIVEIPWQFYLHFGDREVLARYYPNMHRYFDYLELHSERELVTSDKAGEWCLGDWCCPTSVVLPAPFVNTYFYIKSMTRVVEIAKIIGKQEDIPPLLQRIAAKKAALKSAYFNAWDGNFFGAVQGANAFALDIGLGDGRTWKNLLSYYRTLGELDTGIFGTELLLRLLFERGEGELAVRLMTSEKAHSFAGMMRCGATTLFEHWPQSWRDRSHSHPMFGASVSHLYDYLLGIRRLPSKNGNRLVIQPAFPPQLTSASGYVTLKTGRVSLSYQKTGKQIALTVELPEDTIAVLRAFGREYSLARGAVSHLTLHEGEGLPLTPPADGTEISLHTPVQQEVLAALQGDDNKAAIARIDAYKAQGEEMTFPHTVCFPYPDARNLIFSEAPDLTAPLPIRFHSGGYEASNLKAGTTYYWRVDGGKVHHFKTAAAYPRFIRIDGAANVRDLGSNKIRQGLVYRGTDIDRNFIITERGKQTFCHELGIKTELDLRLTSIEKNYRHSAAGNDVALHVLPYRPYRESFEPINRERILPIMELFANERAYPIYMHCMGGADRTGMIALFLQALCGESNAHIHTDYELTGLSNYGAAVMEGAVDGLRSRESSYYREFLEMLDPYAPGKPLAEQVPAFLLDCGVPAETLERIRRILKQQ